MKAEVVFLSNLTDENCFNNFYQFLRYEDNKDFYKPLFYTLNSKLLGTLIALNSLSLDFLNKKGILNAKKQFMAALKYAVNDLDVKVVLLAASTKRLFGKYCDDKVDFEGNPDKNGKTLSEYFPNVLFTNGDNGTAGLFNKEIDNILEKSGVFSNGYSVLVNGAGILGLDALQHLINREISDDQILVMSSHTQDLKHIIANRNIQVFPNFEELATHNGHSITAIINCTHHPKSIINHQRIQSIQNGQKVYVVDTAVPAGFPEEEYNKCENVYRQDAGNAWIDSGLEYFFNPEIANLAENVVYGCFAETMLLAMYLKEHPDKFNELKKFDFFTVNPETKSFVNGLFDKYNISIAPKPLNFNKIIE